MPEYKRRCIYCSHIDVCLTMRLSGEGYDEHYYYCWNCGKTMSAVVIDVLEDYE